MKPGTNRYDHERCEQVWIGPFENACSEVSSVLSKANILSKGAYIHSESSTPVKIWPLQSKPKTNSKHEIVRIWICCFTFLGFSPESWIMTAVCVSQRWHTWSKMYGKTDEWFCIQHEAKYLSGHTILSVTCRSDKSWKFAFRSRIFLECPGKYWTRFDPDDNIRVLMTTLFSQERISRPNNEQFCEILNDRLSLCFTPREKFKISFHYQLFSHSKSIWSVFSPCLFLIQSSKCLSGHALAAVDRPKPRQPAFSEKNFRQPFEDCPKLKVDRYVPSFWLFHFHRRTIRSEVTGKI
jgi:hypothetical protein